MSRYLSKPRGLWQLEREFPPGFRNLQTKPLLVSLCGREVPWAGIVIEADADRDFDWSPLSSFYVAVVVRNGIDATRTVKALLPLAMPYVMLADADAMRTAAVIRLYPKTYLLPFGRNGDEPRIAA